jgi:ABC-type glycerol-3-phosphate transport system substrate-binding protein
VATSGAASSASLVQTASTTATSSSAAVSAAAKAPAPGTTTIEFWQYGGTPYQTVFEQWASQFAATHSSIQVKDTTYATNNNQKLTVVMAAGTDPDAYLSDSDGFKNRAFAGLEGPIDDLVAQDKTVGANLKQMLPSAVQWYQYNGKSYGLPWDYGVSVVIYNLDHMHAAGLTPPAELASDPAKWTWDTLQQYAEQLTVQKAGSVDRAGLHLGWDGYEGSWYSLALANGGRYYNQALDQCTIAGPACVKALDYAAAMAKAGGNATPDWWKTVTGAYKNAAGVFTAGKVSMHYGVSAIFTALAQAKTGIAWDATFLPYDPTTGKTGNWSNMAGLVMNPQSKHRDEAFQFLVYLTTAEAQDAIAAATGECPARLDSVAKTYLVPKVAGPPPGRSTLKPAIDASVTDGTPYVNEDDAWNWMTTAATDVFSGKSTAQEALTALQSQMQAAINTAKARGPRNKRSSGTARRRRAARALAGRSSASSS